MGEVVMLRSRLALRRARGREGDSLWEGRKDLASNSQNQYRSIKKCVQVIGEFQCLFRTSWDI
jgi:hypothetical protein